MKVIKPGTSFKYALSSVMTNWKQVFLSYYRNWLNNTKWCNKCMKFYTNKIVENVSWNTFSIKMYLKFETYIWTLTIKTFPNFSKYIWCYTKKKKKTVYVLVYRYFPPNTKKLLVIQKHSSQNRKNSSLWIFSCIWRGKSRLWLFSNGVRNSNASCGIVRCSCCEAVLGERKER